MTEKITAQLTPVEQENFIAIIQTTSDTCVFVNKMFKKPDTNEFLKLLQPTIALMSNILIKIYTAPLAQKLCEEVMAGDMSSFPAIPTTPMLEKDCELVKNVIRVSIETGITETVMEEVDKCQL